MPAVCTRHVVTIVIFTRVSMLMSWVWVWVTTGAGIAAGHENVTRTHTRANPYRLSHISATVSISARCIIWSSPTLIHRSIHPLFSFCSHSASTLGVSAALGFGIDVVT